MVVESMRCQLEAHPDDEAKKAEAQRWIDMITQTLLPRPGPVVHVEKTTGWQEDQYLPEGLENMVPRTKEDVQLGLKLLSWYISSDYQCRTTLEDEDTKILARWAFIQGALRVVRDGDKRVMQIKETYNELLDFVHLKGESFGRQFRRNWATQDISHYSYGRERLPDILVASAEDDRKLVTKILAQMKTRFFGQGQVILDPKTIKSWLEEIRMASSVNGRGNDGLLML